MASAVDPSPSVSSPSAGPQHSAKLHPIAHEAQVVATGARPAASSAERELFTENTSTVLVFENGGVIRLSADVVPGQLLFLTNQQTRREVVTQVLRKRNFSPKSCYVELEFTEPAPGFWGIEFPEAPEPAPVGTPQREAVELVQSSEAASDAPAAPAPPPSAREVEALKQEVEALRQQLDLLKTQTVPPAPAPQPPAPGSSPNPSSVSSAPSPSDVPPAASVPPSVPDPDPPFSAQDLFPKSIPDFSPPATSAESAANSQPMTAKPALSRPLVLGLVFVSLTVAALAAAWYKHWLPGLLASKKTAVGGSASSSKPLNSAASAKSAPLPRPSSNAHPASGNSTPPSGPAPAQSAAPQQSASQSAASSSASSTPAGNTTSSPSKPRSARAASPPETAAEMPSSITAALKHSSPHVSAKPASSTHASSRDSSADGASFVPPKLLKSVRAVPPPQATLGYVTGNVILDAVVDPSGRVNSMKVLSGPAILHQAAMDALKQYKYAPATQQGRPVPAHVTVTIQFWYEP